MQKNYKDYTVGELLEMGFGVELKRFDLETKSQGFECVRKFEGVKNSSHQLSTGQHIVKGWESGFEISCFLR